jgi:hypothetical protein
MVESDAEDPCGGEQVAKMETQLEEDTREHTGLKTDDDDRWKKWIVTLLFCLLNIGGVSFTDFVSSFQRSVLENLYFSK